MKIILLLIILICFGAMGFLYYYFCKKTSDGVLNILRDEEKNKKGVRNNMPIILNSQEDFVGSYLRSQVETLEDVLATMEIENVMDDGYLDESLKRVEKNLHRIRKLNKPS